MIKNNAKATILITSLTLSIILLLPGNLAFAEQPPGCAIGVANLSGTLIVPPGKVRPGTEVQISYIVGNPDATMFDDDFDGMVNEDEIDGIDNDLDGFTDEDPTNPPACNAEIGPTSFFAPPDIQVDSVIISNDADCPAPFGADITLGNGDSVLLWGTNPAAIYGECNVTSHLTPPTSEIQGRANAAQFNQNGDTPLLQSGLKTVSKTVYSACIEVTKVGPPKTLLVETAPGSGVFEAEVTYMVTVENCATLPDFVLGSTLDNCTFIDTIAGGPFPVPGNPTIPIGNEIMFSYGATIFGDTHNEVEVTCEDQNDIGISDDGFWDILTYTAGITVTKMAPAKLAEDETVIYDVWIHNDGSSTITGCVVDDLTLGQADDTSCTSIASGDDCHVQFTGPACIEAPDTNSVEVTCFDQELQPVTDSFTNTAKPFCAAFDVEILKECEPKTAQVPQNPVDLIDCDITVTNPGPGTLTNCSVTDNLSGDLTAQFTVFADNFISGESQKISTSTAVTPAHLAAMTVTNKATISCDTQETFPPVTAMWSDDILIRDVNATLEKMCEPASQDEPGTITWEWWATNTSLDGKTPLDVECSGTSTISGGAEVEDFFSGTVTAGSSTHNLWVTSGLDPGTYVNDISCTFTDTNSDKSFTLPASATCIVDEIPEGAGCTPGYWKQPQHFWAYPDEITPNVTTIGDVGFVPMHGVSVNTEWPDVLKLKGGKGETGAERILLRAAGAAILNAFNDDIGYAFDAADIIADVNAAIAAPPEDGSTLRQDMLTLAGTLDGANNPPEDWDEEEDGPWCPIGKEPVE